MPTPLAPAWTWQSTPLGSETGFFATRDMVVRSLSHEADDLAANRAMGGYSGTGGLATKRYLLALEGVI